jgi:DNA-binding NtrC family response regulator
MDHTIKKILLIDDEEAVLFGYRRVLSEPWLQVDTACSAQEAKQLVEKNAYGAAIVDVRLSNSTELEGIALIPFIKKHQQECKVVVLTAYGDETIRAKAFASGALLFLEKPVGPEELKKELTSIGLY